MSDAKEYYLVTADELEKVEDAEKPFLDYANLYDKIIQSGEEAEKEEKLKIKSWLIFNWKIK
jgi:guanylate kinase